MADDADLLDQRRNDLVTLFIDDHPMARALGMEFVEGDWNRVVCRLPMRDDLTFREGAGLAPGVLLTVLDGVFGLSVCMRVPVPQAIATIELKIDFIEDARTDADLVFTGECYAIADNVGYARGEITRQGDGGLVAGGSATFMLGTRGPTFFTEAAGEGA
ncbi:acyl-coenzyme A thioesterase PaaI-like protein [Rhodobium orientis]|uniref:Thioesterase domain-containing protein n=1 Tax=Rhodobium orientis TaxID=34017 RepID=A0A327JEZ7_9HYPH|nr:PaaI family thioesterase [Rhodobium orientis]MBB4305698.1 acyl-coenzyme A thioesterase PaaI-like protein [Rhodobium orientis]MBK5947887.1 hypothetical protein [Rhodobium orientis]RAI24314.1 hypothetical protein CH339_22410 [Rhodobium orientis]